MHNPWCISFDRRCRVGGPGCCQRCPFRDDRTPEEKRDSLVASWLHHVKYRAGAKVEDVPIEFLGLPLRAEVARRDAETVLVKGDFGKGQRSKIMERGLRALGVIPPEPAPKSFLKGELLMVWTDRGRPRIPGHIFTPDEADAMAAALVEHARYCRGQAAT